MGCTWETGLVNEQLCSGRADAGIPRWGQQMGPGDLRKSFPTQIILWHFHWNGQSSRDYSTQQIGAEECWDQKVWGTRVHSITPVSPRQIQQEKRLLQFSAQNNCLGLLMKDGWRVPAQSISAVDKWHQHIICQGVFHQRQSRNKNVGTSLDASIFHLLKFWTP